MTEQDLDGFVGCEICEGLYEEREGWFKVHAIGCEDYVIFVRDGRWEMATPIIRKKDKNHRKERTIMVTPAHTNLRKSKRERSTS